MHAEIGPFQPIGEDRAGHPRCFVGIVAHWQLRQINALEVPWFREFADHDQVKLVTLVHVAAESDGDALFLLISLTDGR